MDAAETEKNDPSRPVEVRYRLNEYDLLALNRRARLLFNLRGWVIDWIAWLIIPALLVLFALFDFKDLVIDLIGGVLFGLVLIPAFPFVRRYLVRKRMKATYNQTDVLLIAEERNIRTESGEDTVTISWRSIERSEETRSHFFLFLTRLQALIIPKRSFADAGDVVRLRKLISRQVKDFALVDRS